MSHKEIGYDHAHTMKDTLAKDTSVSVSLTYEQVSRLFNMIEDLHFQMQREQGDRFRDYPIQDYEKIDTGLRDKFANLAMSLEVRDLSERAPQ